MRIISRKYFIIGLLTGMALLFTFVFSFPDGKLHIVFCNVGQGDAVYIRTPKGSDLLIDGGPNDKVLTCLGKYMPFYDRTIDLVLLSHPESDHITGLVSVIQRYNVRYFVIAPVRNENKVYQQLAAEIKKKNIQVKQLFQGDSFFLDGVKLTVLWPEKKWLSENISAPVSVANDLDFLSHFNTSSVLGFATDRSLNDFSYYFHLQYGLFDALFTGDGDSRVQDEIMSRVSLPDVELLKFPHHGSKYAVLDEFLDAIKPELAVISVGKNPWGHPTSEAIKQLTDRAIRIKRTDLDGNVEVVVDGKSWRW